MFKSNRKGFTLLEALLSLFIIGLITQLLVVSLQSYRRIDQTMRADYSAQWYNFLAVFEREMMRYQVKEVTPQSLMIEEIESKQPYSIILKNNKIYKTTGYQPFLYHVTQWQLGYSEPFLQVEVEFDNGQQFNGVVQIQAAE